MNEVLNGANPRGDAALLTAIMRKGAPGRGMVTMGDEAAHFAPPAAVPTTCHQPVYAEDAIDGRTYVGNELMNRPLSSPREEAGQRAQAAPVSAVTSRDNRLLRLQRLAHRNDEGITPFERAARRIQYQQGLSDGAGRIWSYLINAATLEEAINTARREVRRCDRTLAEVNEEALGLLPE